MGTLQETFELLGDEQKEEVARRYYNGLVASYPRGLVEDEYEADDEGDQMWAYDNMPSYMIGWLA